MEKIHIFKLTIDPSAVGTKCKVMSLSRSPTIVFSDQSLVNIYQTTRCYNPEDSNLHTHRRENLKSDQSLFLLSDVLGYARSLANHHPSYRPDDGGSKDLWNVGKLLSTTRLYNPAIFVLTAVRNSKYRNHSGVKSGTASLDYVWEST
jgi:hypothetical protein